MLLHLPRCLIHLLLHAENGSVIAKHLVLQAKLFLLLFALFLHGDEGYSLNEVLRSLRVRDSDEVFVREIEFDSLVAVRTLSGEGKFCFLEILFTSELDI